MALTKIHRKQFVVFYFICFAVTFYWLMTNGLLLQQIEPVFFLNRLDFSRNLFMLSNLQHAIIKSHLLQISFDYLYMLSALALLISCIRQYKSQYVLAVIHSIINFSYAMLLTSISTLSIEGFISWILIPLIFAFKSETSFYYMLQIMRYFFLMIFVSAALWKIRAGGVFNFEQMSAILLKQHTSYLLAEPANWFSLFINYLIGHKGLSWSLYFFAMLAELIFVIGFFTKKYDRWFLLIFLLFLLFDYFIMRINYVSWLVFTGFLWFSKFVEPENKNITHQFNNINYTQTI